MLAILTVVCFLAAFLVHGGLISVGTAWLNWEGLMLLGFLFWVLSDASFSLPRWRK